MKPALHTAFGKSKTLREWSEDPRCVVTLPCLHRRISRLWLIEKALTQPFGMVGPKPEKCNVDIGPLSPGGAGRHQTHARIEFAVPTRITNSSSRAPYVPPFMGRL